MTDPLSFIVLGAGVATMTKLGSDIVRAQPKIVKVGTTPVGVTEASGKTPLSASAYAFDDMSSGPETLWSAARVQQAVKSRQGMKMPAHTEGNIVLFGLEDSGIMFSDKHSADPKVLWSSLKTQEEASRISGGNVKLVPGALNAAVFSNTGEPVGSRNPVNDLDNDPNAIWSASKTSSFISSSQGMKLGPLGKKDFVAVFESGGQVTASTAPPSSNETNSTINLEFSKKLPKTVAPAKHFARFRSGGTVEDSGALLDPNTVGTNIIWPSTRVQSAVTDMNRAIGANINQQTSAAAAAQNFVVVPIQIPNISSKMSLQPSAVSNNFAVFNSAGQVVDSNFRLNDGGTSKNDVWSALKIKQKLDTLASASLGSTQTLDGAIQAAISSTEEQAKKKMPKWITTTKNVAAFDSSGSLKDAGFFLDDTKTTTSNVWSSSKILSYLSGSDTLAQSQIGNLQTAAVTLDNLLNSKMNLVPTAKADNIAVFDSFGQLVDSTNTTSNAQAILSSLSPKTKGSGTAGTFASWETPTSLKTSGVSLSDSVFTRTNMLSSKGTVDGVDAHLSPFTIIDGPKAFFLYKIENWTHPGPAYINGTANYKPATTTLVESNVQATASRSAFFRLSYFGAITSTNNTAVSISPEPGKRQDVYIPANAIVPHYFNNIIARTAPFTGVGVVADPGPCTILIAYISIVEL
jgi:hypothetical protein